MCKFSTDKHRKEIEMDDLDAFIVQREKEIIEIILEGDTDTYLGYFRFDRENKKTGNFRNGYLSKEVYIKTENFRINISRGRDSPFEPKLIKKKEEHIYNTEDIRLLYQKGLSTRDIQVYLPKVYNYEVSQGTINNITNIVLEKTEEWQNKSLEEIYPIVFIIDGLICKVKEDEKVKNKTVYIITGINLEGRKGVLDSWILEAETVKSWSNMLDGLKNRGVRDVLLVCSDNFPGTEATVNRALPKSEIQVCIVYKLDTSLRYVFCNDLKEVSRDLKEVYQVLTEEIALMALDMFEEEWSKRYSHIINSWKNNWENKKCYE